MARSNAMSWFFIACLVIVAGTPGVEVRAGSAPVNLLLNGDFEGGSTPNAAGEQVPTSWTLTDSGNTFNTLVTTGNGDFTATGRTGDYFQFGEPTTPATLSQQVNGLNIGDNYSLSYAYAINSSALSGANSLQAMVAPTGSPSTPDHSQTVPPSSLSASEAQWQSSGFSFVATSSSEIFSFLGRSDNGYVGLDNAVLNDLGPASSPSAVPEPSSMALMGLAFGGLAIRRWRRSPKGLPVPA